MSETTPAAAAHAHINRLSNETSPYLLQHQHNPVDWFAWGPEAFEAARKQGKPIFLSIGYSTCYWCHVMERQCFENESVAAEMNKRFVNVKVDREERPDVDQLYMTAVQILNRGRGGWPMSVWLTPDLRPFFAGTYYPPDAFVHYLQQLSDAWQARRAEVDEQSTQITDYLRRLAQPPGPKRPIRVDDAFVEDLLERAVADYDRVHGGFGTAPKFPRETELELILVHNRHAPNLRRMQMLRHTLDALAAGGIRDQLGGGFHRYSTDARWLVPHFEIMLYDNAMLAWVYAEAFRQTGERRYAEAARGVFEFVLREMTSPEGAFYTAIDAEVDAMEGGNYLWTPREVEAVLGGSDCQIFDTVYGLDRGPNFADPHHGSGVPDRNVLYLPQPLDRAAARLGMELDALQARLARMRQWMYEARRRRKQPLLDTKVITSWNALMIRAFAYGGHVLQERRYVEAAARAATFLLRHHRLPDGGLQRTSRNGTVKYSAFLDDYAFLAQALLALHEAGAESGPEGDWRELAGMLAVHMIQRFGDDPGVGGFYFTDKAATDLIVRQKVAGDSPLPSGNAVAAMVLLALGQADRARETVAAFAQPLQDQGESMSSMVQAAALLVRDHGPFTVSAAAAGAADVDRPDSPQQVAEEVVTVAAGWASDRELNIHLDIADGYHLNAHDIGPAEIPLIPTRLTVEGAGPEVSLTYPPGDAQQLAFSETPLRVYSGEVRITVRFPAASQDKPLRLALTYQACDDRACLPPVTKQFELASV